MKEQKYDVLTKKCLFQRLINASSHIKNAIEAKRIVEDN